VSGRLPRLWLALVYLLLYVPIGVLLLYSFNDARTPYRWGGWSLRWYRALFADAAMMQALWNSLGLACAAASLATAIGALTAFALHRYRFRGQGLMRGLLFVAMMSPEIVLAISLLALFLLVGVQLGFVSLLIGHLTFCLPFVVITVLARLAGFDAQLLEAAAALRTVLLPAILPALLAGWLLGFTLSLDDVVVSTFVGGPSYEVLPLRIYSMVRIGLKPEVNALGTLLLALSLGALGLSQLLLWRGTR
jgi:spermidine/putrescine transport system permease protein